MSNERNSHRTAVILFAVAMIIAILAAFVTTLERVDTRTANNETPPGTTGLAKPHPATGPHTRPAGVGQLSGHISCRPVSPGVKSPKGTSEEEQHDPTHPRGPFH